MRRPTVGSPHTAVRLPEARAPSGQWGDCQLTNKPLPRARGLGHEQEVADLAEAGRGQRWFLIANEPRIVPVSIDFCLMQVAAHCILVREVYGVRPPYCVVVLSGGRAERVVFTPELQRGVYETIREMRRILTPGNDPGPRWVAAKCTPCGYRDACWNQETSN
jgi:Domain of unknown function DUF83